MSARLVKAFRARAHCSLEVPSGRLRLSLISEASCRGGSGAEDLDLDLDPGQGALQPGAALGQVEVVADLRGLLQEREGGAEDPM